VAQDRKYKTKGTNYMPGNGMRLRKKGEQVGMKGKRKPNVTDVIKARNEGGLINPIGKALRKKDEILDQ
tara:strand:+ start:146 stop:352 length:207 start_codon:yes stop_codon:yes gene_type:complete